MCPLNGTNFAPWRVQGRRHVAGPIPRRVCVPAANNFIAVAVRKSSMLMFSLSILVLIVFLFRFVFVCFKEILNFDEVDFFV